MTKVIKVCAYKTILTQGDFLPLPGDESDHFVKTSKKNTRIIEATCRASKGQGNKGLILVSWLHDQSSPCPYMVKTLQNFLWNYRVINLVACNVNVVFGH